MLQGRLFAYADAHRYRLGVNHHQLPVNRPHNEVQHYHRDGALRVDNGGAAPVYHPNSFDGVTAQSPAASPPYANVGAVQHYDHRSDDDYYSQPGALYRLMNADQKSLLVSNIVAAMSSVPKSIQQRQIAHFKRADEDYGARIERGLMATAGE